jgi:hypothetical protein
MIQFQMKKLNISTARINKRTFFFTTPSNEVWISNGQRFPKRFYEVWDWDGFVKLTLTHRHIHLWLVCQSNGEDNYNCFWLNFMVQLVTPHITQLLWEQMRISLSLSKNVSWEEGERGEACWKLSHLFTMKNLVRFHFSYDCVRGQQRLWMLKRFLIRLHLILQILILLTVYVEDRGFTDILF